MRIMSKVLRQCRKPTGWLGRQVARGMNVSHSKMTDWGLDHISIGARSIILDVGCGGGGTVRKLAKLTTEGRVYGIDYSEESVGVSKKINRHLIQTGRVDIRHGSVSRLPFSDDMFDLVTAVESHYFWPDLASDMKEVLRVLKRGGELIIICGVYRGGKYDDRNQKWLELGNMAYHSVSELGGILSTAGYSDVQVFEDYNRGWICGIGKKPSA